MPAGASSPRRPRVPALLTLLAAAVGLPAQDALGPASAGGAPASATVLHLTLQDALRLAFTQGRDKLTQDEELQLQVLSLHTTRLDYGPQPTGTLSTVESGIGRAAPAITSTATFGVSQVLPTGGTLSASSTTQQVHTTGQSDQRSTSESLALHQPLLRGGGMLVWRENLTEAEKSLLYARRAYVIYLQTLAISTASTFWGLQGQRNQLEQAEAAVDRAQFLVDQSQALMQVGKSNANDVFRAQTALLAARQTRVDAEAAYAAALDQFAFALALPAGTHLALDATLPTGPRLRIDPTAAIHAAQANRLDLRSAFDGVADADRAMRLAHRQLLPELDLDASLSYGGAPANNWTTSAATPPGYSVGLTLQIPFTQYDQRLAYQNALIGRAQRVRAYEAARQQVVLDVLQTLTGLRNADASLIIQERSRIEARARAEKAEIDFKAGEIPNRDLLEAQENVRQGENAWFQALVAYRIAELQLRKDTGVLEVGPDGRWSTTLPSYATAAGAIGDPGAPDLTAEGPR